MIENFSKDNYEYIEGGVIGHRRAPGNRNESDDEGERARSHIKNMEGRVSGKTTAKGGPLSNEDEEYEEDEEGEEGHEYKHHRDDLLEDSQTALNNGDLSGIETKPRPQTAKVKNEEDNVFYRRQGPNGAYNSTNRDPNNNKSRETLQEGGEPETIDGHPGMRNERMVKTIANEGARQSMKRHRTVGGIEENENKVDDDENEELNQEADFQQKLKIFQSESKFDDFNYSQYGDPNADVMSRPSRPQQLNVADDDDVRSGNFHSELREQFQNVNASHKIVNPRRYTTHTPGQGKEGAGAKGNEVSK